MCDSIPVHKLLDYLTTPRSRPSPIHNASHTPIQRVACADSTRRIPTFDTLKINAESGEINAKNVGENLVISGIFTNFVASINKGTRGCR